MPSSIKFKPVCGITFCVKITYLNPSYLLTHTLIAQLWYLYLILVGIYCFFPVLKSSKEFNGHEERIWLISNGATALNRWSCLPWHKHFRDSLLWLLCTPMIAQYLASLPSPLCISIFYCKIPTWFMSNLKWRWEALMKIHNIQSGQEI